MSLGNDFAKRFKSLREQRKVTQTDVGVALGVKWQRVHIYEKSGRILLDQAEIMAATIDEPLSNLLFPAGADEIPDADLFQKIVAAWGKLDQAERGTVADVAESLSNAKMPSKSVDSVAKNKKSRT
jgi:transcriptional regulator with XRE-family HTH domain